MRRQGDGFMLLILVAVVVALVFALAGCGGDDDTEPWDGQGVVTALLYDDEDEWTTRTQGACMSTDEDGFCTFRMPDTVHHHRDPPHWHVQITGEDGREHRFEVSQESWDRCRRGAEWINDERRCLG